MEPTSLRRLLFLPDQTSVRYPAQTEPVSHLTLETQFILQTIAATEELSWDKYAHLDIDRLIYVLECHRLSVAFYNRINNTAFPPTVTNKLKDRYAAHKLRMLSYMAELCRVVRLFQANNLKTISLKGPVLGQLYYRDYTERACNDLDIVVKLGDVDTAYQLLLGLGYRLSEPLWNSPRQKALYQKTFHHYNLYNEATDIQIELHWKLFTSVVDAKKTEDAAWANLTVSQIGGTPIPVLAGIDNFIYLCIHGCTHDWKRLFWAFDIAQIIGKEGPDFLIDAYQRAVDQRVERYVLAGCHMAAILFNTPLPPIYAGPLAQTRELPNYQLIFCF